MAYLVFGNIITYFGKILVLIGLIFIAVKLKNFRRTPSSCKRRKYFWKTLTCVPAKKFGRIKMLKSFCSLFLSNEWTLIIHLFTMDLFASRKRVQCDQIGWFFYHLCASVTRWIDYFFMIWPFTTMKINAISRYSNFYKSVKVSPNLVTLDQAMAMMISYIKELLSRRRWRLVSA